MSCLNIGPPTRGLNLFGVPCNTTGLSCATQAGVPAAVVDRAEKKSAELEALSNSKTAGNRNHEKKIRAFKQLSTYLDGGMAQGMTPGKLAAILKHLA